MKSARAWVLPAVSAGFLVFGIVHVVKAQKPREHPDPLSLPTIASAAVLAGTGVVEPSSENVVVGSHRSGVVAEVPVRAGQQVKRGDRLFCLDTRAAKADLAARKADLVAARALRDKVVAGPRAEELPPLAARVDAAKARLVEAADDRSRTERVLATNAVAEAEGPRTRARHDVAAAELRNAEADLVLKRAGAWAPDRRVAEATVGQALANVARAETELELLCATAPLDATVLRVDVRGGEHIATSQNGANVVVGATDPLHVRVDVDEADIPRWSPDLRASAYVRGAADAPLPLELVRIEPDVLPKRALSGASNERVDTRVLQIVYRIRSTHGAAVFVGQQLDVVMER